MKRLSNTIESIVTNVSRHAAVYAAARANHPALASYETIADVLAALGKSSRLSADERDPILVALATEHLRKRQGRPDGVEYVTRVHARKTPAARAAIADRLRRQRINVLQKPGARAERKEQTRGVASTA